MDFETKVLVKQRAPELLRKFLSRPSWQAEPIMMSGVTDCYQPAEKQFRVTRGCLQVAKEFRQPLTLITKNALILDDVDLLSELARQRLTHVTISVTSLDQSLARNLEPRCSAPQARIRAIRELSAAGVPVHVMVAPIIPGLNDSEAPAILEAVAQAGAISGGYTMLRLPLAVSELFEQWLEQHVPDQRSKILGRVRQIRDGKLNRSNFHERMKGTGFLAEEFAKAFRIFKKKFGLDAKIAPLDCTRFRVPDLTGQRRLFE